MISQNTQNIIDALSLAGFNCNLSPIGNTSTLEGTISRNDIILYLTLSDLDLTLFLTTLSYDVGTEDIDLLNIDNPSLDVCDKISNIFDIMEYELQAEQEYLEQEALDDARWLQERLGDEVQPAK
jgi:hypothetical protein